MKDKNDDKTRAKVSPMVAAIKPLARQYVNQRTLGALFDSLTTGAGQDYLMPEGSKGVLIVSRGADGRIYGGHYTLGPDLRVTAQHYRAPVDEMIMEVLK